MDEHKMTDEEFWAFQEANRGYYEFLCRQELLSYGANPDDFDLHNYALGTALR